MYKALVVIVKFFILLFAGLEVEGLENVPQDKGAIVVGNHTSWFDPFILAMSINRPIHFMAKAELFEYQFLKWVLPHLYVFPVNRGQADRQAIRTSQDRVNSGHLLGIFPEGTRNKSADGLLPMQGGAALIAIKTGAPIIPVLVSQGKRRGLRKPFRVAIGTEIDLGGPMKANKTNIGIGNEAISNQFSLLLSRNT